MSIAVSVIVGPSPGLRLLHAGLCGGVLGSALACPGWAAPLLCLLAGLAGWMGRPPGNPRRIDISGVGQWRLTVYQQTGTMRLLDGTTIWPGLLLLRLGETGDDAAVVPVAVLPDCVARADWRALSLACRAVATGLK